MDPDTLNAIKALFEEYSSKESGTVIAAYLTVGGMFGVALLGAISQWLITQKVVNEEQKRLSIQLRSEFTAKRHEKWESDVLEAISNLLTVTDPEINSEIVPSVVTKHIHRVQLLLNHNVPAQGEVNQLVNQLPLAVNGWYGNKNTQSILTIHGQLLDASKKLIYHPG